MTSASATKEFVVTPETVLGIIAGEGKLPGMLAQAARAQGIRVVALALSDAAKSAVKPHADVTHECGPGQLGRAHKLLNQTGVNTVVFIGKIPKLSVLRNIHKFDGQALKFLMRLPSLDDDTIGRCVGEYMEANGFRVIEQTHFLRHLFPEVGVLSKREPTADEYSDLLYGIKVAKEVARLDIGQTVIVGDSMILAIEAVEGTDEAIRRAVKLARGHVVVCKVAKFGQDHRFDIPAVGMNTLRAMWSDEKRGSVLAIEAGGTMVVEREEMIEYCNQHNIAFVAVSSPEPQQT
ncbi:MAG: UDP-2,3-diacylglucosamine diphosphatase LpxI [Candidatus Obscuribacterales bacterium]|nr:UDP-2,3-diacylglucosamine diphosphatase LpxI [Candidatus Obscuribacterales bacterium]